MYFQIIEEINLPAEYGGDQEFQWEGTYETREEAERDSKEKYEALCFRIEEEVSKPDEKTMSWFIIERVHERWAGPPFETEEDALEVLNNSQNRNARVEQILPKKNVCLCRTAEAIEDFDERWDFLDKNEDYLLPCCEKLLEEIRDEGLEKARREGWLAYYYEETIFSNPLGSKCPRNS